MSTDFDPYLPPGVLTSKGDQISVDSHDVVYLRHGAKTAEAMLGNLQVHLASAALAYILAGRGSRTVLEIDPQRTLVIAKKGVTHIDLSIVRSMRKVTVSMRRSEAEELQRSLHLRATNHQTDKEQV